MKRENFLKIYSNIPISLRKEVILLIEEEGPITWQTAYFEIKNETKLGNTILKKLSEMGII